MNTLTEGQLQALRNLAEKHAGAATAFINIADARHLTEIGLAQRSRQGWEITERGLAHLGVAGIRGEAVVMDLHLVRDAD